MLTANPVAPPEFEGFVMPQSSGAVSGSPEDLRRPVIGLVGLGLMGTALTERLLEHGFRVLVWNRTREKADPLIERGAEWCDNPIAACDRVILSLYSSDVVWEVVEQMESGLHRQILIDTTTGEPEHSASLAARLAPRGVRYLDAPVSGSSEQTRKGEATVMVGGDRQAFDECDDLWRVMGRNVFYVGGSGSAAKMKLVTNLVLGLNRAVLAEAFAFAEAIGVDRAAALDVLKGSPAYSRAMDVKGRKMLEGDFHRVQARLSQHLKDVRLMIESATAAGLDLPISQAHRRLLEQAEADGLGDLDNSAILRVWKRRLP